MGMWRPFSMVFRKRSFFVGIVVRIVGLFFGFGPESIFLVFKTSGNDPFWSCASFSVSVIGRHFVRGSEGGIGCGLFGGEIRLEWGFGWRGDWAGGVWGTLAARGGAGESVRLICGKGFGAKTLPKGVVSFGE